MYRKRNTEACFTQSFVVHSTGTCMYCEHLSLSDVRYDEQMTPSVCTIHIKLVCIMMSAANVRQQGVEDAPRLSSMYVIISLLGRTKVGRKRGNATDTQPTSPTIVTTFGIKPLSTVRGHTHLWKQESRDMYAHVFACPVVKRSSLFYQSVPIRIKYGQEYY